MTRQAQIDTLIFKEISLCKDSDMNLLLNFSKEGFSESEVEQRLLYLRDKGFITIIESIGMTTVTGITNAGKKYFHSISS